MSRKSVWVLIALVSLAVSCSRLSFYYSLAKDPKAAFPLNAAGWTRQGETRSFTAANLYEYIDGDAERFVQAGVKQALTADYKYQDKFEAVADVFVMGNAEGARKIFESQPPTGSHPAQLGDAARIYSGSVTFRQGAYFVRLVAYDPQATDALLALGQAIERGLK